ncbi:hypothetical protein F5X99DRAFT_423635 [Biscogniauxia marginata]|nr:hypothetical protein F5X99DRAFT_423635 [Biscogniauxia marginata]
MEDTNSQVNHLEQSLTVTRTFHKFASLPAELQLYTWEAAAMDCYNSASFQPMRCVWTLAHQFPYVVINTCNRKPIYHHGQRTLFRLIRPLLETNKDSREVARQYLCIMPLKAKNYLVLTVPKLDVFILDSEFLKNMVLSPEFQDVRQPTAVAAGGLVKYDPESDVGVLYHQSLHQLSYVRNIVVAGGTFETPNRKLLEPIYRMRNLKLIYIDIAHMCYPGCSRASGEEKEEGDGAENDLHPKKYYSCHYTSPNPSATPDACHRMPLAHRTLAHWRILHRPLYLDSFEYRFRQSTSTFSSDVSESRPLEQYNIQPELTPEDEARCRRDHCWPALDYNPFNNFSSYLNRKRGDFRPDCVMLMGDAWKGPVGDYWRVFAGKGVRGAAVVPISTGRALHGHWGENRLEFGLIRANRHIFY